jgi:hypothetical protein
LRELRHLKKPATPLQGVSIGEVHRSLKSILKVRSSTGEVYPNRLGFE